MRRSPFRRAAVLLALAACGGKGASTTPVPVVASTPARTDSLWADAMALYGRQKWSEAGLAFDRALLELPSGDPRNAVGRFYLGESRLGEKSSLQAVREFRRVSDEFPADTLAPWALLRAGDAYLRLWRKPELDPTYGHTAYATYRELLTRYPEGGAAKAAGARIADVENRFAFKEYKAALFYMKLKAYDSAIHYLMSIIATWPRAETVPDALDQLIKAYRALNYVEDVREKCTYYRAQWPQAPNLNRTCPAEAPAPAAPATPPTGG